MIFSKTIDFSISLCYYVYTQSIIRRVVNYQDNRRLTKRFIIKKEDVYMIISNLKGTPNVPQLKNKLKARLDKNELKYAQTIANDFLSKTLISHLFITSCQEAKEVYITRNFESTAYGGEIKKEIIEYAGLIIWAKIFAEEDCPNHFEVTLDFKEKLENHNILYRISLLRFV